MTSHAFIQRGHLLRRCTGSARCSQQPQQMLAMPSSDMTTSDDVQQVYDGYLEVFCKRGAASILACEGRWWEVVLSHRSGVGEERPVTAPSLLPHRRVERLLVLGMILHKRDKVRMSELRFHCQNGVRPSTQRTICLLEAHSNLCCLLPVIPNPDCQLCAPAIRARRRVSSLASNDRLTIPTCLIHSSRSPAVPTSLPRRCLHWSIARKQSHRPFEVGR